MDPVISGLFDQHPRACIFGPWYDGCSPPTPLYHQSPTDPVPHVDGLYSLYVRKVVQWLNSVEASMKMRRVQRSTSVRATCIWNVFRPCSRASKKDLVDPGTPERMVGKEPCIKTDAELLGPRES